MVLHCYNRASGPDRGWWQKAEAPYQDLGLMNQTFSDRRKRGTLPVGFLFLHFQSILFVN